MNTKISLWKKLLIGWLVAGSIMLMIFAVYGRPSRNAFRTDYLEKYYHTLNAMFDFEWTLISVEDVVITYDGEKRYDPPFGVYTLGNRIY